MPTVAEIESVRPVLKQLTEDDYAAMKAGKKTRQQLADALLGYVGDAESEAAKFLLIQTAFKNYMGAYESEMANAAFKTLDGNVKDVPKGTFGSWCAPYVAQFAKNGRADALASLLNNALDSGDSKSVSTLMTALGPYMRKLGAGTKTAATPFAAAVERAQRQTRREREVESLKAAVRKSPSDASLHERYALALAATGDWAAALKEFALSSGPVAEAAAWETKWPNAGASSWTPAKAADLWWDRGGAVKDEETAAVLRGRSAAWYKVAIENGELTGLRKTIAEKRIREVGQSGTAAVAASAPAAASEEPQPSRRSRRRSEAASAPAPEPARPAEPAPQVAPVTIKGGPWTLPKTFQTPLERSLDLGKGVSMPFCACPAGSFKMIDHKVVITRPYWISKTPFTLKQLRTPMFRFPLLQSSEETVKKIEQEFKDRIVLVGCYYDIYIESLNRNCKGILPPGYVFRLPTEAEYIYAYNAGKDDDRAVYYGCDRATANTGEAFAKLGWIPKADKWDWKSIPDSYRWAKLANLPDANGFGFVSWADGGHGFPLLDTVDCDMASGMKFLGNPQSINEVMQYAAEEIDPLRFGKFCIDAGGQCPRKLRRICRNSVPMTTYVVIGPDLEAEKKAAKK